MATEKFAKLTSHIHFLEWNIFRLSKLPISNVTYPTMFEYYSAIHMSKRHQKEFHVWQNIDKRKKKKAGFPIMDMGVDVSDLQFNNIVQSKYYRADNIITYGKLATFLSMPMLTGKSPKMTLIRTEHSLIDDDIGSIVDRGDLEDLLIKKEQFLQDVDDIKNVFKKLGCNTSWVQWYENSGKNKMIK